MKHEKKPPFPRFWVWETYEKGFASTASPYPVSVLVSARETLDECTAFVELTALEERGNERRWSSHRIVDTQRSVDTQRNAEAQSTAHRKAA